MTFQSWGLGTWVVYIALSFLPALIAYFRMHRAFKGILAMCFFSWLPFLWIVTLFWAIFGKRGQV